eukprot:SM000073S21496  [mRNA]  locus=s73:566746:570294:- [translate_table: standard]
MNDYRHARAKVQFIQMGIQGCVQALNGGPAPPGLQQAALETASTITNIFTASFGSGTPSNVGGVQPGGGSGVASGEKSTGSQGAAKPLQRVAIDYCSDNVDASDKGYSIKFDKTCGARFHSVDKYNTGLFSAQIQCASGDTSGIDTTFYLSSLEGDSSRDAITLEFLGNKKTKVQTNIAVNGVPGQAQATDIGFDCSGAYHTYSIKWDTSSIIWYVDGQVVRQINKGQQPYPSKSMYLYASMWDASQIQGSEWSGPLTFSQSSYTTTYNKIMITSPLTGTVDAPSASPPPTTNGVAVPLSPIVIDYCQNYVKVSGNDAIIPWIDGTNCGGRIHSVQQYPSGRFTGMIKCPAGDTSGLVTSFYLSSLEGSTNQDEIDFEFLGKSNLMVQTNYYVNGVGGHEVLTNLGFDCSQDFHKYSIAWSSSSITWYIDDVQVRQVQRISGQPYPVKPSYLYSSIWNAGNINGGGWAGSYSGRDSPYAVSYKELTIESPI